MPSASSDKSFERLALPHLEAVFRVARRLVRDENEAEDLVQETFLKAHRAFSAVEVREFGLKPWLMKILHNTFLTLRSRDGRAPRSADHQALEAMHDTERAAIQPLPQLDYEALDGEVKTAIDQLAPEYRSVIVLWATMEFSYQEIADTLSVPIGTVMSRLHRARQQLARGLEQFARAHRLTLTEGSP